jgi:hypothetical protein
VAVAAAKSSASARRRRRSERYRAAVAGTLLMVGVGAALMATSDATRMLLGRGAPGGTPAAQSRIGKIVLESSPVRCRQLMFDNDTGRMYQDNSPCDDGVRRDASGTPMPMGTVHRLEAISKAFGR